jgi:hypothetical protein
MDKSLPFASMPRVAPRTTWPAALGRHVGAAAVALCIALTAWFAWSAWPGTREPDAVQTGSRTFAHWHGDGHDWLFKAEPEQGVLVVYDAADGRPLQRLPVAGVREIVLEDDWLFVIGSSQPHVRLLRLPQLAWWNGGRAGTTTR